MAGSKKSREFVVTVVEDCPEFPERMTRRGDCKYPFHKLESAGMGLDVLNRNLRTVREALKRWKRAHGEGMVFTVRQIEANKVRVRRDK
jgi:hypothetical protein